MINFLKFHHYLQMVRKTRPKRYVNLFKIVFNNRCRRILEIGTFDGVHAVQMIQTASIFYPVDQIEYVGFDLFEQLGEEQFEKEFAKYPPPLSEVQDRLEKTGADITLYQGDTGITLPKVKAGLGTFDFIFIDGGHSIGTISSDWNSVRDLMGDKTIVIFDDYFTNPLPRVKDLGCQSIIDSLDKNIYNIQILRPKDKFVHEWGILEVNFAKVVKK